MVFVITTLSFYQASFFDVVALSVDRFLAIHLHLRYEELVTHKCVVVVVISIWLLSVFLPLMMVWAPLSVDIFLLDKFTLGVIGLLLTTVVYIRIYFAERHQKNQIQTLQVQQLAENSEIANFARLVKSAVSIFYVYVTVLVCYAPHFISLVCLKINGPTIALHRFFFKPSNLLLKDETHSTNSVQHIAKCLVSEISLQMPQMQNCQIMNFMWDTKFTYLDT